MSSRGKERMNRKKKLRPALLFEVDNDIGVEDFGEVVERAKARRSRGAALGERKGESVKGDGNEEVVIFAKKIESKIGGKRYNEPR